MWRYLKIFKFEEIFLDLVRHILNCKLETVFIDFKYKSCLPFWILHSDFVNSKFIFFSHRFEEDYLNVWTFIRFFRFGPIVYHLPVWTKSELHP